jgi:glycosyltransferase involved in cell wall biosynthesis
MLLEHLLVGLADESIPVALVCPPGCNVDSIVSGAVEVIRHPAFDLPLLWRQNKRILVEQLERFKPTVLHCLCESKMSLTRRLAGQLDLPYVLTVSSLQKWTARFSISLKRCAKIIVPAKTIAANIAKVCPNSAQRIEQINIGTFVEEHSSCFPASGRLPSMLTAHPLDNVNDFENLFGAVRHLAIGGYEFMLVVIGSGRAERDLRELLAALGLSQIVTIVPRLEPKRSVLAAGDIFIQPRPSAAFNPLLLEAMSVGTAIAACKGQVDELVIEGRTCVVFDPDDELSIMGSLRQLFDRPELARQLAKSAQQYLKENYSVSNMISSILRTYRDAQQRLKR